MAFEGLSDKLGKVFSKLKNHGKLNEKDVKKLCVRSRWHCLKRMSASL